MKNRIPLFTSLVFYGLYKAIAYFTGDPWLPLLIFCMPILLLILNFQLRKKLKYKGWFTNNNPLFAESESTFDSNIEQELLYDKLLEVIEDSSFELRDENRAKGELLISTPLNLLTWGENIYIQIESTHKGSKVHFNSVTIFGNSSWSRNDRNYEEFYENFEQSLII